MTLLHEIQKLAAEDSGDLTVVLKKCKILAARLGSAEFAQWISFELDGYPVGQSLPEYRRLSVGYYANFMGVGWQADKQPFLWPALEKGLYEKLNPIEFREGLAKAAALVAGAQIPRPELALFVQGKMFPDLNCVGAWAQIGGSEFKQLLSAVSSRILDFALEIEKANPNAGEAQINSQPVSKETLQPLVQNFFGPVGNIAQNSHGFSQTAHLDVSIEDLNRLAEELRANLSKLKLEAADRKAVTAQIATIEAQIKAAPNPTIIREAGKTIRSLTEGAIGNFIAAATQPTVFAWIREVLQKF